MKTCEIQRGFTLLKYMISGLIIKNRHGSLPIWCLLTLLLIDSKKGVKRYHICNYRKRQDTRSYTIFTSDKGICFYSILLQYSIYWHQEKRIQRNACIAIIITDTHVVLPPISAWVFHPSSWVLGKCQSKLSKTSRIIWLGFYQACELYTGGPRGNSWA